MAAALGANWSLANGMLLWPLLIVASFVLRLRRSAVIAFAVTGVASCGLYFHHYLRPLESSDPLSSLRSPLAILLYVSTYLGSAWVTRYVGPAMLLGAAGLAVAVFLLTRCGRYVQAFKPFAVQLILTVLFCLGTALLTAAGRVNLGLGQALASRYQTVVLLFWWALGLLVLFPVFEGGHRRTAALRVQLFLIAVMLRAAALTRQPLHEARSHRFMLDTASIALLTGVNDTAALQQVYPGPDVIWKALPYLRTHELSVFAGSIPHQLGTPLDSVFRIVAADDCMGSLESSTPMDQAGLTAIKISGWAWDNQHRRPAAALVATNHGVIAAWAAVGGWRPSVRAANPKLTTSYVEFSGYVAGTSQPSDTKFYAILGGTPESACPLAAVAPIDQR